MVIQAMLCGLFEYDEFVEYSLLPNISFSLFSKKNNAMLLSAFSWLLIDEGAIDVKVG